MAKAAPLARPKPSPTIHSHLNRVMLAPRPAPPLLELALVERLLSAGMSRGADFAEVFLERTVNTAVIFDEQKVKSAQSGVVQGVGIRVISGAKVGYAYSDDLDEPALMRAAATAALIADGTGSEQAYRVSLAPIPSHYHVPTPLMDVELAAKAQLLKRADKTARAHDPRVRVVQATWADNTKRIQIANTHGLLVLDTQNLCRLNVSVIAEGRHGERRSGVFGGGGRVPFSHFDTFTPELVATEAARQATATLGAADAAAGPQTVVLAPGWSGILLHEAVGHGLEADFIRKGTSLFTGQLGNRVASDLVTVIDDGTVAGGRGSINVDDEGTPAERKVLIEKGQLKGYMFDALNAKLMGQRSTGSGRRESFRHLPLPRMTNTYLAPGNDLPEDILRGVKRGLYCANFGGGQVDITNGNFVFEVSEAYQIEDGKLGRPVKGAVLVGVGPEALKNVSAVGCDPMPDPGMGVCGKDGQGVPVGVGLPTLRIDDVTVGGTRVGGGR